MKYAEADEIMIRINEVALPLDYTNETVLIAAARTIGVSPERIKSAKLVKRSVDARKRSSVQFTAAVEAVLSPADERAILKRFKPNKVSHAEEYRYELPACKKLVKRPVVVGAGPGGLFAALMLARMGQSPILIERGKSVDDRTKDVLAFWKDGALDTKSNVQFGEGGAGAFSDGKLNTGTKDPRTRMVLEELAAHGAPKEILWLAKPHIGTDRLKPTVKAIREDIISLGGEVRFSTQLVGIKAQNGKVVSITVEKNGSSDVIETDVVILAIGHSSRDTFEMLFRTGFAMESKPFSVGVRIEQLQENINKAQYGSFYDHPALGAADYKLNVHLKNGRGVYTFCMCPGGYVVASASEENTVVTNGMSEFARDGINANSALLVGVNPADFGDGVLSGVEFQRKLERTAFIAGGGGYKAPVQRVADFLENKKSIGFGAVHPTYRPGVEFAELSDYLPGFVCDSIKQALPLLNGRLHGFADGDALLTGAETRSSSPVRILRGADLQSLNVKGVYPCGEGAGYAGGITSAAVDGVRCAEAAVMNA